LPKFRKKSQNGTKVLYDQESKKDTLEKVDQEIPEIFEPKEGIFF